MSATDEQVERIRLSIMDEGRALANALVPGEDLGLSRGEGALHLAFASIAQQAIEDVYADCGDSDAGVLATNVGQRIAFHVYAVLFGDRNTPDSRTTDLEEVPGE